MISKQWRKSTDQPTKTGWYFARRNQYQIHIRPVYVHLYKNGRVTIDHSSWCGTLKDYTWFGPVDEIEEVPCKDTTS